MSLSIINWNILYAAQRPSDEERFSQDGKATEAEKKAGTAALAFFCYTDNTSPSIPDDKVLPQERQKVKQQIREGEYVYYRGGSNAAVRMPQVQANIQSLADRADVVCLQEVTEEMKRRLDNIFQATHEVFYSYKQGNNHGVMVLVKKKFKVIQSGEVTLQGDKWLSRLVPYVDIQSSANQAVIRVAAAHLYGHKGRDVSPHQEAEDLFSQLAQKGPCDTIVLAADTNVAKGKLEERKTDKIYYAQASVAGGWRLNLTNPSSRGIVCPEAKRPELGLCAIMQDKLNRSRPIDLSNLPRALSDHAPIGTIITLPKPAAAPAPVPSAPKPKVTRPTPASAPGGFFGILSRIWATVSGFFRRLFSR